MKLWFLIRKLLVSRHETKIGMPGNDKRYIGRYYLPVRICTMRSAVRPSQRSGSSPRFHSPFISVSIALASSAGSSPTNSLVPIRQVSGCSAYVFSVMQGMPSFFGHVAGICDDSFCFVDEISEEEVVLRWHDMKIRGFDA